MNVQRNNKLTEMRKKRGMSQVQLAEKAGISLRTLQYYEQGQLNFNGCKIEKIFAVALALNCDVEDILTDEKAIETIRKYQEA